MKYAYGVCKYTEVYKLGLLRSENLNKLEIRKYKIPSGYENKVFFIDGKPMYKYIYEWISDVHTLLDAFSSVDDLEICWTNNYDFEGDARFMKYILEQKQAITPILSCPEDFDFSCIVIVADVVKKDNKVMWKRIGMVNHSDESFEKEKCCGILFTEAYTDEDWDRFGDNIAMAEVDSPEWIEWISNNWSEELYRRRVNYTYPYYQNDKHIDWFADCCFEFDETEYNKIIMDCYG